MLNYIWAGLIAFSFLFAAVYDTRDLVEDTYRNGQALPLEIAFPNGYDSQARGQDIVVSIDGAAFASFYGVPETDNLSFEGLLVRTEDGVQIRFAADSAVPIPLNVIREITSSRDNDLRGPLDDFTLNGGRSADGRSATTAAASVTFAPVRFVKMQAIADAANHPAGAWRNLQRLYERN